MAPTGSPPTKGKHASSFATPFRCSHMKKRQWTVTKSDPLQKWQRGENIRQAVGGTWDPV